MTVELERQIITQIRYQAWEAVWRSVGLPVTVGTEAWAGQHFRDYVWSRVGGRILNQVFQEVWSVLRLQSYEEHDV
jgi:hypothetical protein